MAVADSDIDDQAAQRVASGMKARFTGICHNCGKLIELGDAIRSEYNNAIEGWRTVHDDCCRPTEETTEWRTDQSRSRRGRWATRGSGKFWA